MSTQTNLNSGRKTDLPAFELSQKYNESDLKQQLRDAFQNHAAFRSEVDGGPSLYNQPFMCCCMPGFIENESLLVGLMDELSDMEFFAKDNDLYKFQQSDDLKTVKSPYISSIRTFLYNNFREWVQDITGLSLTMTMDMSCARYNYTDTLLCHDDMLEGRRIAYILYLVPTWEETDGGALEVFNSNGGIYNAILCRNVDSVHIHKNVDDYA